MLPTLVDCNIAAILSNVVQNIDVHGLEGKAEEEAEGAVRGTSAFAMS